MTEEKSIYKADTSNIIEQVVIGGDLSKLTPEQRVNYYVQVCKSLGLNPMTRPFEYIVLNGRLTLYARKDATEQLRKINNISIGKPDIRIEEGWFIVTVEAHDGNGRTDSDIGVVNQKDMRGDFGNALMKAVTKAKRRVTLSICGLGMLDETEVETIPDAKIVDITDNTVTTQSELPIAPPPPAKETNGKDAIYQAVVDAGLSENVHSAKTTLTHYCQTGYDTAEKAIAWMRLYRGWRDKDNTPQEAGAKANKGEVPQ